MNVFISNESSKNDHGSLREAYKMSMIGKKNANFRYFMIWDNMGAYTWKWNGLQDKT